MRGFLLLVAGFMVWLAGLAVSLPAPDPSLDWAYGDDPPPAVRYADIALANSAAGFHIPTIHNTAGWRIESIFVTPTATLPRSVDVTYASDNSAVVTMSVNSRRAPPFIKGSDDNEPEVREERVRFAGQFAPLVSYKTASLEVISTEWSHHGMQLRATAFVYPSMDGAMLTKQQLLDVLETVH